MSTFALKMTTTPRPTQTTGAGGSAEGQTREDNIAMRNVFLRSGFIKEAHYRRGWPVEGSEPMASVAYAILRQDWESGTTTAFEWEDLTV